METEKLLSLYSEYLSQIGRSNATITSYLSNLKLFLKWFMDETKRISFTSVTEVDLLSYRNYLRLEKRQKPATINQHVAALRSFFAFLESNGIISTSVITNLKPLSKPYLRAPEVPKRSQILKLFRMVNTHNDRGKRDFAILQLFVQCGLRLSEVAFIELTDIDISQRKGRLRIINSKGGQQREISLNKTARHALKDYLQVRPTLPDSLTPISFLSPN